MINIKDIRITLVKFIKENISNAGYSKAVIGISGGIDSAVTATLATEALGKENVFGLILPYKTSNPQNIEDAKVVINNLSIKSELIEITPMVDAYCNPNNITDPIRRGNIMARTRMIILYDISAREKALVIGTSNKSEICVGYGTQFGDLACAINPLGNLYKTQIWQLAKELNVPQHIIDKAPSADLWTGQTDENELGITYKELDKLLIKMIDEKLSDSDLINIGFKEDMVKKVRALNSKNKFKGRTPIIADLK